MKKLITIILFVLFTQGCGGSSSSDSTKSNGTDTNVAVVPLDYKSIKYKNEIAEKSNSLFRGGITLEIPISWYQEQNIEIVPPVLTTFYSEGTSPKVLTIVKTDNFIQSRQGLSNISEVASRPINFSSFEGTEVIFTADIDDIALKFMQSYVEVNSVYYSIFFFSEAKEFDRYIEVSRYIASTSHLSLLTHETTDINVTKADDDFLLLICEPSAQNSNEYQLYGKIMSQEITFSEQFLIDDKSLGCLNATAQYSQGSYLVVYGADYNDRHLVAKRVSKTGVVLDNVRIPISFNSENIDFFLERGFSLGNNHKEINILFDGDKYLVTWRWRSRYGSDHIMGRYIDTDGVTSKTFAIHQYVDGLIDQTVKAAISNNQVLVTWSTKESSNDNYPIVTYGKFVNDIDVVRSIAPSTIDKNDVATARFQQLISIDNGFVFSWVQGGYCSTCEGASDQAIKARIISHDGLLENVNLSTEAITVAEQITSEGSSIGEAGDKTYFNIQNLDNKLLFSWIIGGGFEETIYHMVSDHSLTEISDITIRDKKIGYISSLAEIDVTYSEDRLFFFQTAYEGTVVWAENKPGQ
ncbi:hypothetical protein [Colwellia hornerae]|uniref:Uncharacterized protein n=1 Tax=Colwellia hornerae TaxID=89402 RepID=A0A5C6Q6L9_9GAMM|nr:hypothetical protein [Colwellia hornerae]TWX48851.1 hypothetical protein ESZ28_16650 [Colwellia hornerae]TWX55351.1 hypothetical protein ESZ26_16615 [Colwellia hornerae]TWX64422.1 hypothetical protein ESZ27_14670 [Colwellia hornerae]